MAPSLFVAASDSKHFWAFCDHIYRFSPIGLHVTETAMFHGNDERLSVEGHAKSVAFYRALHRRCQRRTKT